MNHLTKVLPFIMIASACSGGDDNDTAAAGAIESSKSDTHATVTIGGKVHEFSSARCFTGNVENLGAILLNNKVRFEATQLSSTQNAWAIEYSIPLGDRQFEKYATSKHETKRSGNKITGTARVASDKQPENPIDISYDITC